MLNWIVWIRTVWLNWIVWNRAVVMALEGVTKRTEHHGYSISIYLQEKSMVTRT